MFMYSIAQNCHNSHLVRELINPGFHQTTNDFSYLIMKIEIDKESVLAKFENLLE